MAKIELYFPHLLKWEGGYVNDKVDKGGATNMGVTLGTWKNMGYDKNGDSIINEVDIMLLTKEDALKVLKKGYWDKWEADEITNQSIAEQLVEWVWGSGIWGIKLPQRLLKLKEDGVVGPVTLKAINSADPKVLHSQLVAARLKFVDDIVKNNSSQSKFIKGWKNRINDFKFSV